MPADKKTPLGEKILFLGKNFETVMKCFQLTKAPVLVCSLEQLVLLHKRMLNELTLVVKRELLFSTWLSWWPCSLAYGLIFQASSQFFPSSPFCLLSCNRSLCLSCPRRMASRLELGRQGFSIVACQPLQCDQGDCKRIKVVDITGIFNVQHCLGIK